MTEIFARYDSADYFKTDEDIAAYLEACAEENDSALLAQALGAVSRALDFRMTFKPGR